MCDGSGFQDTDDFFSGFMPYIVQDTGIIKGTLFEIEKTGVECFQPFDRINNICNKNFFRIFFELESSVSASVALYVSVF